ncbi:MAG: DVU_1553 family AMP-dependent CoA ligase [Bacteroidales bacterium]
MISPVHTWTAERTGLLGNLMPETLLTWQQKKLELLIQFARINSKFYQEHLPDSTVLTELPFTSPTDIASDPYAFLAIPPGLVARVTTLANSGTTPLKKRIFFSKADLERTIDFFAAGMSTMTSPGDNAQILISNRTENSLGSLLSESLSRIGVTSNLPGVIRSAGAAIEASRSADCLIGMPAELLYMCRMAPDLRPKSVLLAADYIPQSVIEGIKETWDCSVFSHYGHTEFGFGCTVDCLHHNGYHLRDADLIFEIIEPGTSRAVNHGERGELVVTTLSNEAMPLIRYRTGHISRIIHEPCSCGGSLHRLGRIEGRIDNVFPVEDGKTISIHQLDEILFADPSIRCFNASLNNEGRKYTLQLTIDSNGLLDLSTLAAMLPQGLKIEVKYASVDPFSHRSKRRIYSQQ